MKQALRTLLVVSWQLLFCSRRCTSKGRERAKSDTVAPNIISLENSYKVIVQCHVHDGKLVSFWNVRLKDLHSAK